MEMKIDEMLKRRGLTLRKTHNLIQVRNGSGAVYQSHDMSEIEGWLMKAGVFVTLDSPSLGKDRATDNSACARRYGRITMRP